MKMDIDESRAGLWVLITVILGTLLGSLDRTVVNLALPDMMTNFGITISTASWIATAYILANAIFVPVWGKLGDIIGRKKVYIAGFVVFVGSSLLAGVAWSFGSLLFFRVIQALAVSADYPTAMAIIATTFSAGRARAKAMGIWSASVAAGAIIGPLIGGPLIDNFGWRSIFLINVPLGAVGVLMAYVFVKESKGKKQEAKFDVLGAITLAVALSAVVMVLDKGISWGWASSKSFLAYSIAVCFFILFYFIEVNHKEPIINFDFFKNRVFVMVIANTFVVFMGLMGSLFLIPLFAQSFLGYSSTEAGYLFLPMAIVLMIAAPFGAKLGKRMSSGKVIAIGTFIASGGMFLFSFIDPRSAAINLIFPFSIMAFGMGMGMSHRPNLIVSAVSENNVGSASAIFMLLRNIAGAFGVAFFATILSNNMKNNILDISRNTILNSQDPIIYREVASLIILKAQVVSYAEVFVVAAVLVFIAAVIALFIEKKKAK